MPIINRVAEFEREIAEWRQDFHRYPELQYDVQRTAERVAELLKSFGVDEVATGIGRTGVVAVIRGRNGGAGRTIGLRADMDALPITERTGKDYASLTSGKMHACGHDGHTAMLLGAAKYLAETRNFAGTAVLIFQPAEEGGAGARAMLQDGLVERFGIEEFYGMHNLPGLPTGRFGIREGGIMAATDEFNITIEGKGGHAALPHNTIDPVTIAAQLILALQTIVSRNVDPMREAVLSVTMLEAGQAFNIIPRSVKLTGTIRTLDETVRGFMEERLRAVTNGIAATFGATATISYRNGYPVTVNAPEQTAFAAEVARTVSGAERVDADADGTMGGEDFAYMLQARPGAYIFIGNGPSTELHTDTYDFNDEVIPVGVSYWAKLVENSDAGTMMLRTALVALALFGTTLPAVAARIVPRCDLPMKDAKGRFDWGFGPNVGESKAAARYEQMLISTGVDAHLTRFFSGCLQTWVEIGGKDKMKFYDPDTLEEIPLDR